MQTTSLVSISPSFNSYSNTTLAEIAARVVEEFGSEEVYGDDFYFDNEENLATPPSEKGENFEYQKIEKENSVGEQGDSVYAERGENRDEEEEFEFAFVPRDSDLSSPISAGDIFYNGQIRPVYPVFDRDLFLESMEFSRENGKGKGDAEKIPTSRLPLRKLFREERETTMTMATTSSCSSSDADELDGIPEESYCVWRPKEESAAAEGRCNKSSSTGSNSKRWKLKVMDLLHRSHSDGVKDDFVIMSPSNGGRKKQSEDRGRVTPVSAGKVKSAAVYGRDGGEKRRSYLPFRPDLVGIFANVNGLSKNLQPF